MSDGGPSRAIVLRDEGMVVTIGASAEAKAQITDIDEAAVAICAWFNDLNVFVSNIGVAGPTGRTSMGGHV